MTLKKPTALKELEGTARADRMNPLEPRLPNELPDRPAWVDEESRTAQLFDQIVGYINDMQISTRVDGIAVSLLADQLDLYLRLREDVRKNGEVIEVASRYSTTVKANPALREMNTAYNNIVRMLREYGLTAVSRTTVNKIEDDKADDFESFLEGS